MKMKSKINRVKSFLLNRGCKLIDKNVCCSFNEHQGDCSIKNGRGYIMKNPYGLEFYLSKKGECHYVMEITEEDRFFYETYRMWATESPHSIVDNDKEIYRYSWGSKLNHELPLGIFN